MLVNSYEEEQTLYIQNKINEINNAVSNNKSALAWKAVNEVNGRKKSNKGKIKATSDIERIQKWNNHFSEILISTIEQPNSNINGNTESEYKPEMLDIETGLFKPEELLKATKSVQNGKATGLDEIPVEVWKLNEFQDFLLESCNNIYMQKPIERWTKG